MLRSEFTVVKGYRVASGLGNDLRFPHGTISAQLPFFKNLGLDLTGFYLGTLNAKFDCKAIVLNQHDFFFNRLKWHSEMPEENFKFYRCHILYQRFSYSALIYQPQKTTKVEHFQPDNQLELLAPFIQGIGYGDKLLLQTHKDALTFI